MWTNIASILAFSAIAAATPQTSDQQCITTIGLPGGCCPPHSSASETVLIDCKGSSVMYEVIEPALTAFPGCSLTSVTTGIMCMMLCPTPAPIEPGTTTVTSCKPSTTIPPSSEPTPEPAGEGFVACTKTITTREPWRCTVTRPAHTTTYSSDCSCCDLTTTTLPASVAARCMDPPTTVLNWKRTKTETVCASSTSCSIYW